MADPVAENKDITKNISSAIDRQMEAAIGGAFPVTLSGFRDFLGIGVQEIDKVAPHWSSTRDRQLQEVWMDGQGLSWVVGKSVGKLATIPLNIIPRDESIDSHVTQADIIQKNLLINSEFAQGWYACISRFVSDYLTTDNGAFMEVIGTNQQDATQPLSGPVVGVRHLDSLRCTRLSTPLHPVRYNAPDGKYYDLHASRVIFMSQLPSSRRDMNGVGYCSVSRSLLVARALLSAQYYKEGKMGSLPAQKILVADGMTAEEVIKMMVAGRAVIENLNLEGLQSTVIVGGRAVDMKKIDLASFDQYDEETMTKLGLHGLALAFGLDPSEVFPEQRGTRASDTINLQRSRSQLPQQFVQEFKFLFESRVLPSHLKLELNFPDDQQDKERAIIQDITARNLERLVTTGGVSQRYVLEHLYRNGNLDRPTFVREMRTLGFTPEGYPIESVIFSPRHREMIIIQPTIMVPGANDEEAALRQISANRAIALMALSQASNQRQRERALDVIAAMDRLEKLYKPEPLPGEREMDRRQPEPTGRDEEKAWGVEEVAPAFSPFFSSNRSLMT